jgi:beta-glucosidase/6-phospho-beta-glucosidase/beta-galactosidase
VSLSEIGGNSRSGAPGVVPATPRAAVGLGPAEPEPADWVAEREAEEKEDRAIRIHEWLELEKEALEKKVKDLKGNAWAEKSALERLWSPLERVERHECLGFEAGQCPEFPGPYGFSEAPEQYDYSGGFPEGFIWGLGTAAYQIEGGYKEGGRGASIWDTFTGADTVGMPGANCAHCCKKAPCPVNEVMFDKGATGNVACDHWHMWREDVALMRAMGLKHYRFSISWPRIYPTGRAKDGVNLAGVDFYNGLIDELLSSGITPYVTLYHWDLPQGLLDPPKANGWWARDPKTGEPVEEIVDEWLAYVDTCFSLFGDRVKVWLTFNEAWTFTWLASGFGKAPSIEPFMNMSRDPYIAAHNVLRAHAKAVDLYRSKYQPEQDGQIGITNNCDWKEPLTDSPADVAAAERGLLFQLGWLTDPIFGGKGDYPEVMKRMLRERLPRFTEQEKRLLDGSSDFLGINHYGTGFAHYTPGRPSEDFSFSKMTEDGLPRGQSEWLYGAGWGFRKLLYWIGRRYKDVPVIVTEGGWSIAAESAADGASDFDRVAYYANYTSQLRAAIYEDGVDVRGYFAWSLMDNFEWERGYSERFGVTFSDFNFSPVGSSAGAPNGGDVNSSGVNSSGVNSSGVNSSGVNSSRELSGRKAGISAQLSGNSSRKAQDLSSTWEPTAGRQIRTRKESSCWLEAVWRSNQLVDPYTQPYGCIDPQAFAGHFEDSSAPGCVRTVLVSENKKTNPWSWSVHVAGTDSRHPQAACEAANEKTWGPLLAYVSGSTFVVDFSSRGGRPHLQGFWDREAKAIRWADGSVWRWDRGVHARKSRKLHANKSVPAPALTVS